MQLTEYHAKHLAHDLTKQAPLGVEDQLSMSLVDASVDLNPHQIEAAMLAAMPKPDGPIVVPARPDAKAKACQLRVPDAVFRFAQRQVAPRNVAVEQCPAPGLTPHGDHMALVVSRTALEVTESCGNTRTGQPSTAYPLSSAANISRTDFMAFFPLHGRFTA